MTTSIVDAYLIYAFIRRLVKPFSQWEAFKLGVINDKGEILVPPAKRTEEQKKSLKLFDVMILNLKRLLATIPGGNTRIATFTAALFLLKEDSEMSEEELAVRFKNLLNEVVESREYLTLMEEVLPPSNNVGDGKIAGTDNNPPVKNSVVLKRDKFAGATVFDVDYDKIWASRHGKHPRHRYSRYLGECDTARAIRDYCVQNPKESIVLRNEKTGEMVYFRRVKK